jgi:hypothetical protein
MLLHQKTWVMQSIMIYSILQLWKSHLELYKPADVIKSQHGKSMLHRLDPSRSNDWYRKELMLQKLVSPLLTII